MIYLIAAEQLNNLVKSRFRIREIPSECFFLNRFS